MSDKLSDSQITQNKTEKIMNVINERCSYYRANPHRFCEDFLGIHLKLFQKILLWAMMHYDAFYFVAARSLGKTYLVALFGVCRCILYPGTKLVACSYTFKQGKEIILKVTDDFMQKSSLLRNEISKVSVGQNDCCIYFKNGSFMKVVVAGESARGTRSNILIIDESRMVPQATVDTILRPMNGSPRQPGYLKYPEFSHLQEMNKEMYMSSAYYAASEMYDKVKSYAANMLNPKLKYFIVDLPYMISIKEGLLLRQQIENEMSEVTFNDISFSMEREGLFYGSSSDAFFDFRVLNNRRVLEDALFDLEYYHTNNIKVPEKQKGEIRIVSVDVALMASKKHDNDASCLTIHSGIPTSSNNYMDNVIGVDTKEGLTTDELGLRVMRYFYQYDCDYIVLDTNGVGLSIFDYLTLDRFDPMYNQTYGALNCINDETMASRCKIKSAPKVVFSIKANSKLNNDMALMLRAGFQNENINLLVSDANIEERLSKIRGYGKLSEASQVKMKMPFLQTTFLINELVNLEHDVSNGYIKVKEKNNMRKDRFSSLEYGYYILQELSKKLKPKSENEDILSLFSSRAPKRR